MIDLSYPHGNPGGEKWEESKPPRSSENNPPPRPSTAYLYTASMMTEDAWKVVGMIERANEVCARRYASFGFEAADAERHRMRMQQQLQAEEAAAATANIWSVEDIVGDRPKKRSASSEEPERSAKKFCAYGAPQSAQAISAAPPGYGHPSAIGNAPYNQWHQLDTRLATNNGVEARVTTPLSQVMMQQLVGDYCCRFIEQMFHNQSYVYQCIYCHQRFMSVPEVCQHQVHVHPFAK